MDGAVPPAGTEGSASQENTSIRFQYFWRMAVQNCCPVLQNETIKSSQMHSRSKTARRRHKLKASWDSTFPISKPPWLLSALVVSVCAAACYANSLGGQFVFDDSEAVVNNEDLRPGTPAWNLLRNDFWGTPLRHNHSHKSYRPLTVLSFRWNYWTSDGLQPWGFHLTNVALHCAVSVLSLLVYDRLFGCRSPRASLLAALLFAVHPVHSEAVAGVVGRADLLCSLFYFVSFLLYCRAVSAARGLAQAGLVAASVAGALAAMLCKEPGITVIGLCSSYDVAVVSRLGPRDLLARVSRTEPPGGSPAPSSCSSGSGGDGPRRKAAPRPLPRPLLWRHAALAAAAALMLALRWWVMGSAPPAFHRVDNPASFADSFFTRVLTYNYVYALNAWLLVCPEWLCFDWSMGCVPLLSARDPRVLGAGALWLVLGALLWSLLTLPPGDHQRLTMAVALTLVPFLPATNLLFRVGFVIAERVLYLPSAGFCMLVVLGCCRVAAAFPRARHAVGACYLLLLLVLGARAAWRSAEWRSEASLFASALAVCPLNAKVHYNVAKNAADAGNRSYAVREYETALRLNPEYDQAMNNLANILRDERRLPEAERLLRRAVELRPVFAAAWMNLGIVLSNMRRFREAEESYATALRHRRNYPDCLYNLGNLRSVSRLKDVGRRVSCRQYLEQRRYDDALLAWTNATALKPTHTVAWNNMVIMLDNIGRGEQAELVAQRALERLPAEPSLHFNLANVLGKSGRFAEAERHFAEAVAADPRNPVYHTNLGVLYHRWKKYARAERHYRRALELSPQLQSALENMALLQRTLARAGTHPARG
ncbi:protein O-mannosyl-transferase TMTC4-like isoform X2 [Bacillus rossius redtenbacheri]|uniref:protein O-mannosyl-transferase TMTC4-like isoform X2 n=1 Tax=Bacillus rossius redtenbacheri TaxID=93214 RepID=UPI002FDE91E4